MRRTRQSSTKIEVCRQKTANTSHNKTQTWGLYWVPINATNDRKSQQTCVHETAERYSKMWPSDLIYIFTYKANLLLFLLLTAIESWQRKKKTFDEEETEDWKKYCVGSTINMRTLLKSDFRSEGMVTVNMKSSQSSLKLQVSF